MQLSLEQFLAGQCRGPAAGLARLVPRIATVGARIAARLAAGPLTGTPAVADAAECVLRAGWRGHLSGLLSGEGGPVRIGGDGPLLVVDPMVGGTGTVFSVLPAAGVSGPGDAQLCAGYLRYGAATELVLTVGDGVHAFALLPGTDRFHLVRSGLRIPAGAGTVAADMSRRRFWEPAVRRWVDECLDGEDGPLHRDVGTRWTGSVVEETHRVLTRGGVCLFPWDADDPDRMLRLRHAAAPLALLIEQAGGAASTGRGRVLDVGPGRLRQRVPLIAGSRDDVIGIEGHHLRHNDGPTRLPLYGERGLFRPRAV